MGRIEIELGSDAIAWPKSASASGACSASRTFRSARAVAPTIFDALAPLILADLGRRAGRVVPRQRAACGQTIPVHVSADRTRGGRARQASDGWRVDLEHPALTIHVEMLPDHAFYFFGKEPGAGGLPTGTGGRVACLLSGGIDSPVAAYRMMRRGCSVLLIHFHSYPILSRASQEKVREIAALLTRYQLRSRLAPRALRRAAAAGHARRAARAASRGVPPADAAHRRAARPRAGTRARSSREKSSGRWLRRRSRTSRTIAEATTMQVLRPLVGMDKDEITAEAARIGTLTISNIPDQDCCQLFTPRHPSTRARVDEIERAEEPLPLAELVEAAVAATVRKSSGSRNAKIIGWPPAIDTP